MDKPKTYSTPDYYISRINAYLAELHRLGVDVAIDNLTKEALEESKPIKHWFPSINPCAYEPILDAPSGGDGDGKWTKGETVKLYLKALFMKLAPRCQCCAGARIAVLLALVVILGVSHAL